MDQMERDHRKDMTVDAHLRDLRTSCQFLLTLPWFADRKDAYKLVEMAEWAWEEQQRIVRRWD